MADKINYADKYDVFLSYRRDGGETMAVLLRDRLAAKGYRVFLDVESLNPGLFNEQLLNVIEGCTDFLLVCSKGSLDRCKNKGDWVRLEIACAFENGKNIIPFMLRGFTWPKKMPDDIAKLPMQNGLTADNNIYFDAAIEILCNKFLKSSQSSLPVISPIEKPDLLKTADPDFVDISPVSALLPRVDAPVEKDITSTAVVAQDISTREKTYVPKGLVTVTIRKDDKYSHLNGHTETGIANSFMMYGFGQEMFPYVTVLVNDKLAMIPFSDIKTITFSEIQSSNCILKIIDIDGDVYESSSSTSVYISYLSAEYPGNINENQINTIESVEFDWSMNSFVDFHYASVERKTSEQIVTPSGGFSFMYLKKAMYGVLRYRESVPMFTDEMTILPTKIKAYEITAAEIDEGSDGYKIAMNITNKSGDVVQAETTGNIEVSFLTKTGYEYVKLQDIKRIVFL